MFICFDSSFIHFSLKYHLPKPSVRFRDYTALWLEKLKEPQKPQMPRVTKGHQTIETEKQAFNPNFSGRTAGNT